MLSAIITMLIEYIKFRIMVKKCLIEDGSAVEEVFEYKGRKYDKRKFVQLKVESLEQAGLSQRLLKKHLKEYEDNLSTSKTPDLDMAFIEAFRMVIKEDE